MNARRRSPSRLLCVLCMAVIAGSAGACSPVATHHLTVMTWNIAVGRGGQKPERPFGEVDLQPLLRVIRQEKPDLLGMQEVDRFRKRSALTDQPRFLGDELKMRFAYDTALALDAQNPDSDQYGLAVLSRFPIESHGPRLLFKPDYSQSHPEYPSWYDEQRIVMHAGLRVGETLVHFFVAHLGLTPDQRETQIREIVDFATAFSGPKIIVGDFNAQPSDPEMRSIREAFRDALDELKIPYEKRRSYPAGSHSTAALDHIFVSSEFRVLSGRVIADDTLASDHNPVLVELEL